MNNKAKISIITITYNLLQDDRLNLFRACMESVHNQTYPNVEHIIIDGASSDGTLDILKDYENKGWCKVYSEPDQGIDDAYNKGTIKSRGKYIAWLNSDDAYYDNHAIENMVENLEKQNADYCYGNQVNYTRNGKKVGEFIPKIECFWKDMPFSHQTLAVKKTVLEAIGGYNTELKIGGDYYLVLQLILNDYKGIYINKFISRYNLGGFSGSYENKQRVYTCTTILAHRMAWLYKQFYPQIDIDQAHYIYWYGNYYWAYPKLFLLKLIRFMIEKRLKNFDYNSFINYINSIIYQETNHAKNISKNAKIYLFDKFKILTIKEDKKTIRIRLFNLIPLIKIKKA